MVIEVKNRRLKAALEDGSICLKRFGKVISDDQQRSFNDEQKRWRSIRHIEILSIEDTHG